MSDDLSASILYSAIVIEYNKLSDEQRKMITVSPKPIRDFCSILIEQYGHEHVRKMYVHDGEVLDKAFLLFKENLKEL